MRVTRRLPWVIILSLFIACISEVKGPPIPLQFSPFEIEKSLRFVVFLKNEKIGVMNLKILKENENFRIVGKTTMMMSGMNFEDTTDVLITKGGVPIKSFKLFTQIGKLEVLRKEITYKGDTIFSHIRGPDGVMIDTLLVKGPVYDNEEIIALLSHLPLYNGYWTRLPLFVGDERGIYQVPLRVKEKKKGFLVTLKFGERVIEILYEKQPPFDPIYYFDKKSGFYLERM